MDELISVIVPVYKVERYLPGCIESILAQTYGEFELILVDDGSPDRCGEICDRYAEADPRVRVIHQANGGVSRARNRGLEEARGTYIAFCDSDDGYEPEHLETLLRRLRETGADSAVTAFKTVTEDGKEPQEWPHWEGVSDFPSPEDRIEYLFRGLMSHRIGWEICLRLFRRSIIEAQRIRFCETCGNLAEDLGFVIKYVLAAQKETSVNRPTYRYLQRAGSMMHVTGGSVKLDQVNEVSKYVYPAFSQTAARAKRLRSFKILHAALIYNQASKLLRNPAMVKEAVSGVKDQSWMKKHLRGVLFCCKTMQKYFGKEKAWKIVLLSHYIRHQNRTLYRMERALINRWFIEIETY